MKNKEKNTVLNILGNQQVPTTMMCSFRCNKNLWNDFGILCSIKEVDKTTILINYIENVVYENRDKIEAIKRLKGGD